MSCSPSPEWISIRCFTECYCAICGVVFGGLVFKNAAEVAGDQEPLNLGGREYGYDPETISPQDAMWIRYVHVVGYVPASNTNFISGPGLFDTDGNIILDPRDIDNRKLPKQVNYVCYQFVPDATTVYPVHWPCYKIFARVLYPTAKDPVSQIDLADFESILSSWADGVCGLEIETRTASQRGGNCNL
ncbi:hypothetical protein F4804DRAFT_297868 [Jackrogersella minutella]|nr:hypothetical protein F4804DRAFT_297868 [Jackrogersella minutella]